MFTVGSYEAKTHLPKLLEQVANGETFMITKHGMPVAMLTPVPAKQQQPDVKTTIQKLRSLRSQLSLNGLSIRAMIEDGRRF
jgi:prevent-host-death family protein